MGRFVFCLALSFLYRPAASPSLPLVNSPSLSVFGRPLFQGGSSGLGGLHVLGEEEGVLPLAIVAENEVKGGIDQEGLMVDFG